MLIFAPDALDNAPEILTAVSGIPTMRGYRSPPTAFDFTSSQLGADATGAAAVRSEGSQRIFVATSAAIYEYGSDTFTDRSRVGGYSGAVYWKFCAFGTTYLAVCPQHVLQKSTTAAFSNVTAPSARAMDAAGYFVMLGDCNDTGSGLSTSFGSQQNRVWWSRYGDATSSWEPDVTTQCGSSLLADTPSGIKDIKAWGNDFIIYKPTSMYRGYYAGPPEVFKFDLISNAVGCAGGVVKVQNEHYFIGNDDVYRFDGSRPVSIGAAVREWLFNGFDKANLTEVQGRHDEINQLVYWHYRPTGSTGALTKVLCYHYPTQRFGAFDLSVQCVLGTDNDKLVAATSDGTARQLSMAYIDSSKYIKSLSAAGTDFSATTAWVGAQDQTSLLRRVRPKFRTYPSGGTLTPSSCMYVGGSVTTGSAATITGRGSFDVLQEAFYHRSALALTGDPEIEAVAPELVPAGDE